jgi:hypothetical protein
MDKYTEEQKILFTAHLKRLLKVVPKQSIYKVININSRTFENRLITQKWKDHEIEYYKRTFNF